MSTLDAFITLNTYIISDTHLDDKKVGEFSPNRLPSTVSFDPENPTPWLTQHNNDIIEAWNSAISATDRVFCLGDFAWRKVDQFSSKLSGKKAILLGNHDKGRQAYKLWDYVIDKPTISLSGILMEMAQVSVFNKVNSSCFVKDFDFKGKNVRIMFSHLPVFDYSNQFDPLQFVRQREILETLFTELRCDLNVHGHIHDLSATDNRCINVCVERIGLGPVTLRSVLERYFRNNNENDCDVDRSNV
ncbi:hypothetical protein P9112_012545 [Eukaryota sp. TZLM1-RC]